MTRVSLRTDGPAWDVDRKFYYMTYSMCVDGEWKTTSIACTKEGDVGSGTALAGIRMLVDTFKAGI